MATEESPKRDARGYRFAAGGRNVYGDYIHATFVRRNRWAFFWGTVWLMVCVGVAVFVVLHTDYFLQGGYHGSRRYSSGWSLKAAFTILIAWVIVFVFPFMAVISGTPLFRKGCSVGNFAWPRFYGWQCAGKRALPKYRSIGRAYFSSFERYAMEAVVGERSVLVSLPGGRQRRFALGRTRRAYRAHGLVILESGPAESPSGDVVLDVSGMGRAERREFFRFLDSRLPAECRCYYPRLARPPKGRCGNADEAEKSERASGSAAAPSGRLPIGSVVRVLGFGDRTYMVCGHMQRDGLGRTREYLLCAYPEGRQLVGPLGQGMFADRGEVSEVVFEGYRSERGRLFEEFLEDGGKDGPWDV